MSEKRKEKKGFTKEDLQRIGQEVWADESVRSLFLDEAGKFSLKKTLKSLKDYVETVRNMAKDIIHKEYQITNMKQWLGILGAAAYVVLPLDILPDWIPGAGTIDDIAAVSAALLLANDEILAYKEWKKSRGVVMPDININDDTVIDADYREVPNYKEMRKQGNAPIQPKGCDTQQYGGGGARDISDALAIMTAMYKNGD